MPKKIPIAIIGATGYTGCELVRLLAGHPAVEIAALTSRQYAGQKFSGVFPSFAGTCDARLAKLDVAAIAGKAEVVFSCLPHHEAMTVVRQFHDRGKKVIDLSADFRLKDAAVYEKTYGKHSEQALLAEAVYGLPEIHAAAIAKASLIASPGCYPTSIVLALAPLVKAGLISTDGIICDSKSGVSGAGRKVVVEGLFCAVNENFKTYAVAGHRHQPEMEQELSALAGRNIRVVFTPHLVPMNRGILSTLYVRPEAAATLKKIRGAVQEFYKNSPFVHLLDAGINPETAAVTYTNDCHLQIHEDAATGTLIILSALDNLVKGASGQAVQCLNLMLGLDQKTGLTARLTSP